MSLEYMSFRNKRRTIERQWYYVNCHYLYDIDVVIYQPFYQVFHSILQRLVKEKCECCNTMEHLHHGIEMVE